MSRVPPSEETRRHERISRRGKWEVPLPDRFVLLMRITSTNIFRARRVIAVEDRVLRKKKRLPKSLQDFEIRCSHKTTTTTLKKP